VVGCGDVAGPSFEHGVETVGMLPAFADSFMWLSNTTDQVFEEMRIMMGVRESGME